MWRERIQKIKKLSTCFATETTKMRYRASGSACDFSSVTFVIVTVRMKKNIKWFNDILPRPPGTGPSPCRDAVSTDWNGREFLTTLHIYCSHLPAGEENLGQNEVDLTDVCAVLWGDRRALAVCHRMDECAQLSHPGKLPGCSVTTVAPLFICTCMFVLYRVG